MEALDNRPVRDRGEEVARDLGSSWCAIRTSKASAIPATRRHSVGPPDREASKLQTSIAPSTIRSRHPAAECSLCPAQIFAPLAKRTSRIARRSFPTGTAPRAIRDRNPRRAARIGSPAPASILVRVRGQYEPVASRVPSETGARVLLRLEPADLELEPGQSGSFSSRTSAARSALSA